MSNNISDLRALLFEQLRELRSAPATSADAIKGAVSKASAVSDLARTLIDTARVEVDYLKATGGGESAFIDTAVGANNLPAGITGITRHRLAG